MKNADGGIPAPDTAVNFTAKNLRNFWAKVNKDGPLPDQSNPHYAGLGRCWVWTAIKNNGGYGRFGYAGKVGMAHKFSYLINGGDLADDKPLVLHRCDNPSCVNPDHLFTGTHADNAEDKRQKDRCNPCHGETNGAFIHRDKLPRGDASFSRKHPERIARGERQYFAKLTEEIVREMRVCHAAGESSVSLGARFGVSQAAANYAIRRKTWKHVE